MKIYAHRGASHDFPEMTALAYENAVKQGADGFECDLRLTKDGVAILWHDADLKRRADNDAIVAETKLKKLKAIYPQILTLDEFLDFGISEKKSLLLETKHPVPTKGLIEKLVLQELKKRKSDIKKSGININIMSFSFFATQRIVISKQFTPVYLVAKAPQIKYLPAEIYGVYINLLKAKPELIELAHKRGKKIYVWTVNEAEDMEFCARNGVAGIITDNPARAKNVLGYS